MRTDSASAGIVRRALRAAAVCVGAGAVLASGGCIVGAAIGGMAESARRTGSTTIPAEYTGLAGKSYAVVVAADRIIEGTEPGLTARLTQRINDRLAANVGASAFIPSRDLLVVLYEKPQWTAMAPGEVAKMLGVDRLVWVEVIEYRLHEPGNQYVWDGAAAANVFVYEADSGYPDDPAYDKALRVAFPDSTGLTPMDVTAQAVTTELSNRLVNRAAWLFYEHDEPNVIPY
jgi:hypothetical protein